MADDISDKAAVFIAAGPQELQERAAEMMARLRIHRDGAAVHLEPRLWEALRIEMQKRYRLATGEHDAVLTVTFGGDNG